MRNLRQIRYPRYRSMAQGAKRAAQVAVASTSRPTCRTLRFASSTSRRRLIVLAVIAQDSTQERVHEYVRENTARAWKAVEAIEKGDAEGLGRVMAAAQVCARG